MENLKHTQGDWWVSNDNREIYSGTTTIANLPNTSQHHAPDEERKANAKLIASAPELLAALVRFQDEWIVNGNPAQRANNYSIEQQIYKAIQKATT